MALIKGEALTPQGFSSASPWYLGPCSTTLAISGYHSRSVWGTGTRLVERIISRAQVGPSRMDGVVAGIRPLSPGLAVGGAGAGRRATQIDTMKAPRVE
jgi:hypothetical protein